MRVGNQVVPRYQTQSGNSATYATPTNRFRNAATLMPMGINTGGFGLPMGNSGRDAYQNAVGLPNQGSFNPSPYNPRNPVAGREDCKKCWDLGCECVSATRKGIKRCICDGNVPDDIIQKIRRDGNIIIW